MIPELYQKVFEIHLNKSQYLTLQLLIMLVQSYRNVSLSQLAELFPQPIKYESRVRNLQRFLNLPQLSAKVLWFPIIKHWLRKEFQHRKPNRYQRRRSKKSTIIHQGYLLLALDRTQWQERNIMMLSLVWGKHALPVYWELLDKKGNSNFSQQKRVIAPVLRLLRSYPIVLLGDREFHSVKLANWLNKWRVDFALRQKKNTCISDDEQVYVALEELKIKPGTRQFYANICCTKKHQLGNFNLAAYWKRKYRGQAPKAPWYILTSLPSLHLALSFYAARWGIETLFKDCKNGGYNLENTKVNERRLLATILLMTIAYTLATFKGISCQKQQLAQYICRPTEKQRAVPRHSDFFIGLYGFLWVESMALFSDMALVLMNLKPHKHLYFQRGLKALSYLQSTV
ncbi:IS4 family transposase [Aliinostoc sp. HNIBRCY26]|uniref:IS4 family transposase n=1 Tax=Aliinostoc sp. HNIBRCY26 TaxID=3418997 RepID=UPI003D03511A